MSIDEIKQMYPDQSEEPFYGPGDYNPLLESLGEILLQVDDNDYQGDSRLILKKDNKYGILIFGWGSCSGCDALQAAETYQDILNIRNNLECDIKWLDSKELLLDYINTHDWEGDYSWHTDEQKVFLDKAKELLKS